MPFPLDGAERKLWAHLSEPPPTVPGHAAFDPVIARALAKDPSRRFASGAELGAAAIAAAGATPSAPTADGTGATAALLDAARRSESAIRVAAPELAGEAAELVASLERAAGRAGLLRDALAETPPERIERRLAEVRAGQDPGKAKLVAALARQLAAQRRMHAALAAYDAETERILVELETVRARLLSDDETAAGHQLAALQDELETLADRLASAGGESAT